MELVGNWSYPTAVKFGAGRISEIAEACKSTGISKPLLVTDKGLASMEITSKTLDLIEAAQMMLKLVNAYYDAVAARELARKTTRVDAKSATSTFWQGTRSRGRPRHQTPIACPMWLVSSNESRQAEDL